MAPAVVTGTYPVVVSGAAHPADGGQVSAPGQVPADGARQEDWGSSLDPWEDQALDQLVTGEAVALELPPASVAQRMVSGLVDVLVQGLLLALLVGLLTLLAPDEAIAAAITVTTVVGVLIVGPAALETRTHGRSLGKLVMGLRAVRDDGGPVSFHHSFVRHLLSLAEIWLLLGVPALVSAVATRKGKRLGDAVAGTYVIGDRFVLRLPAPVQMPPPLEQWAARADIGPMPPGLLLGARQLLVRTTAMSPAAAERLVAHTVRRVSEHVAPSPPPGTPPLAYLAAVVAERRRRDEQRLRREAGLRQRLTQR